MKQVGHDRLHSYSNCIPRTNVHVGYYGLIIVKLRLETFNRSHDNLNNAYRITSILYM